MESDSVSFSWETVWGCPRRAPWMRTWKPRPERPASSPRCHAPGRWIEVDGGFRDAYGAELLHQPVALALGLGGRASASRWVKRWSPRTPARSLEEALVPLGCSSFNPRDSLDGPGRPFSQTRWVTAETGKNHHLLRTWSDTLTTLTTLTPRKGRALLLDPSARGLHGPQPQAEALRAAAVRHLAALDARPCSRWGGEGPKAERMRTAVWHLACHEHRVFPKSL